MQRDLVLLASNGDHNAFASLAADAYGRLHRTARLILRREDLASDAVQEALTSAWLHIRAVRDPDRFDAWLNRLVVRACYQELRRERRGLIEIHVDGIEPTGVDDSTASFADRDQLERGFARLSAEHRAVIAVHHYLGLPDAEAGSAYSRSRSRPPLRHASQGSVSSLHAGSPVQPRSTRRMQSEHPVDAFDGRLRP